MKGLANTFQPQFPFKGIVAAMAQMGFNPRTLFANNEPGVWYDPSDLSTLFQDSAGTTPVTAVEQPVGLMLDKSGRGNHAYQTTATSRPVLSARVNQYLATEMLATQNITTLAAQYRLSFEGAGTITLSGTATGVYSAGSHLITCTAGTLTSTVSGSVTKADLRVANDGANLPPYQRVNTATDYDTVGFPHYLRFDGVDDWMVTPTITPGTDKAQVFAGVRKIGNTGAIIVELGVNALAVNGSIYLSAPDSSSPNYGTSSRGTIGRNVQVGVYASPATHVLTSLGDISGDSLLMRVNSEQKGANLVDQGSGNYLAYPLYIGRRSNTMFPFNGHLYSLIVRFGANLPIATIENTEKYINTKTRAY